MANGNGEPFDFSDIGGRRIWPPEKLDFSDIGGRRIGEETLTEGYFTRFGNLGQFSVEHHPEWVTGWTQSALVAKPQVRAASEGGNQGRQTLDFSDLGGRRLWPQIGQRVNERAGHERVAPIQQRVTLAAASQQEIEPHTSIKQYTPDDQLRDMGGTHEGVISAPKAVESGKISALDIPSPDMHMGYRVGRWLDQKLANMTGHPELAQQAEDAMMLHVPEKFNRYLGALEQRLGFSHPLPGTEPNLYEIKEQAETPLLKQLPSDVAGEIQKDPKYGKRRIYDPVAIVEGLGQGLANTLAGLSAPENIALMAAMQKAPRPVNVIAGAGFAGQMTHGAVDQGRKAIEFHKQGKSPEAIAALTGMTVNAVMAALSARSVVHEASVRVVRLTDGSEVTVDPRTTVASIEALARRVKELHESLHPVAQTRRTTVGVATVEGPTVYGVGANSDIAKVQRTLLKAGEIEARLPMKDGEYTALNKTLKEGFRPKWLVARRPICPDCRTLIESLGGRLINETTAVWDHGSK